MVNSESFSSNKPEVEVPERGRRKLRVGGRMGQLILSATNRDAYAPYPLPGDPQNEGTMTRVNLLRKKTLENLPEGAEVVSIAGDVKTVGTDHIDTDTRHGFTAYGIPETVPVGTSSDVFTAGKIRTSSKK
jgi:hypothetical protein